MITTIEQPSRTTTKSPFVKIAAIAILSLSLNLAFLFSTPPPKPEHDALSYDMIARLITGYGPDDKSPSENWQTGLQGLFRRGLTYPLLLGVVYAVAGSPDYTTACLVQALILSLTVFLTFLLGRIAFGDKTALLASLLYALYLPAVWHTNFLLTETMLALVFTAMLWLLAVFLKNERPLWGLLAGLAIGIVGISHPVWLVMPAVILLSLYYHYRHAGSRLLIIRRFAFVLIGVGLVLMPWNASRIIWKLPQLGEGGTGFGAGGGFTFYVGSRVETRGLAVPQDYVVVETYFPPGRLREVYESAKRGEITIEPILLGIIGEKLALPDEKDWMLSDADYYRAGAENWLHKPLRIPELVGYKMYWYLFAIATSPSYPLPSTVFHNDVWRWLFLALNWPGVLLAVVGLILVWKRHRALMPLFVPLVFHTATIILTYPDNRYKYPDLSAAFLLIAFAAPLSISWVRARLKATPVAQETAQ